ncbi:MAG: DUF3857 domain-containing protein [Flavobacteriales bacterium]
MLKGILLSILFASATTISFAQRPSEKFAEKKKSQEDAKTEMEIFGDDDADFKITTSPQKWEKESAVILCQKYDYSYVLAGMNDLLFTVVQRRRIKLNDSKAIEEFSIFYYENSLRKKSSMGFRIIKPDGTVNKVDLSDAVEVKANEVPSIYQSNYINDKSYKKIAIPNLVVGDIIDYFYTTENQYKQEGIFSFSPFIFRLCREYPIVKQKYYYNVDKGYKVSFRTFNGAPKIQEGDAGVNKYGKVKDHIKTYLLEDENREKYNPEYWKYSFLSDPTVKFQVNFVPKAMVSRTELLVTDEALVDKPFDLKEIQQRVPRQSGFVTADLNPIVSYIKKYHKTVTDPIKLSELTYEYLRYYFFNTLYFGFYSSYSSYKYEDGDELPVKDYIFTNSMLEILKKLKVDCEYVVAVNRQYGKFEDVLLVQELVTGVKVKDRYFFYFTNYTSSDYIPSDILGSEAITFAPALKYDKVPFKKTTITRSDYKKNNISNNMDIVISDDLSSLTINLKSTYKGSTKTYFTKQALMNEDYFDADKKKYDPEYEENNKNYAPKTNRISKNTQFKIEEEKRKEEAEKKEKIEKKYEALKKYHKEDYDISKYNEFKLISDGRFIESPELTTEENFNSDYFINKAGRNYIFNIGGLLGKQFELDKEDMERKSNIHLNFPKSLNYTIKIKIPTGYIVEGLDQLNFNIDNTAGSFISKVKEESGYIILETTKNYKLLSAEKSEWKNFISFLETAYDFSQKKVILKKQ